MLSDGTSLEALDSGTKQNFRGAAWSPDGELNSGTTDNLVGPFWKPDGSWALVLRGPDERVYTV